MDVLLWELVPIHRDTDRVSLRRLDLPRGGSAEICLEIVGNKVQQPISYKTATGGGSSGGGAWERCSTRPCLGEVVSAKGHCIKHCDPDDRSRYLAATNSRRGQVSLRGVDLDATFLVDLLQHPEICEQRPEGPIVRAPVSLGGATISGLLNLEGWTFTQSLDFLGARFEAQTSFRAVVFQSQVGLRFIDTTSTAVSFTNCTFEQEVDLSYAHAEPQSLGFEECSFHKIVRAQGFYGGGLHLSRAIFARDLLMPYSTDFLIMNDITLHGDCDLANSELTGFHALRMDARAVRTLGPVSCHSMYLQGAHFRERVKIDCSTAGTVDLTGARLAQGGRIEIQGGTATFQGLTAGGSTSIAGKGLPLPQVSSLSNADAGVLTLSNLDLSRCPFYDAHDLAAITLETQTVLPRTPPTRLLSWPPWAQWRTPRQCVADEFVWRFQAGGRHGRGWQLPQDAEEQEPLRPPPQLDPGQVAVVYRSIRRSFEERSNEPGAADYYYGEMEMRRHDMTRPFAERLVVWLYWFTSGYGLRALRAVACLIVALLIGAVLVDSFGIEPDIGLGESLQFSVRAALPGLDAQGHVDLGTRDSGQTATARVTDAGDAIDIALTIIGPVLFALALLAIRGRVRR